MERYCITKGVPKNILGNGFTPHLPSTAPLNIVRNIYMYVDLLIRRYFIDGAICTSINLFQCRISTDTDLETFQR